MQMAERIDGFIYRHLLSGACLLAIACVSRAQSLQELEGLVRGGHRAAVESIRTLSVNVTVKQLLPKQEILAKGTYWRSLDVVRVQERAGNISDDYVVKGSEIRQVGRIATGPGRTIYAAQRRATTERLCRSDVWLLMNLSLAGPGGRICTIEQYLDLAKERPKFSRERAEGHDCIKVNMRFDDSGAAGQEVQTTLWFDPTLNYLVRKGKWTFGSEGSYFIEQVNSDFIEPEPGIFFPIEQHTRVVKNGKDVQESSGTLSSLRVNAFIPNSQLSLPPVPSGTMLKDWIEGKSYPIDDSWQPMGRSKKLERLAGPMASTPPTSSEPEYRSQSTDEPKSWTRWLLPGALCMFACASVVWLYRRYSAKSQIPD